MAATESPITLLTALGHIGGSQPIIIADPVWRSLHSYTVPLAQQAPEDVESQISPHTASLVYNNLHTLNCQRLLYSVAQQLLAYGQEGTIATANAVHVVRVILKDLTEQLLVEQLLQFIEMPVDASSGLYTELKDLREGSLISTFCHAALCVFKSDPQASPGSYLLQLEVCQLLVVMASTQLYTPHAASPLGTHPFLDALMMQNDLAPVTSQSLLKMFIDNPLPPPQLKLYTPTGPRSVLRIVRSAVGTVLWLPYTAVSFLIRRTTRGGSGDGAIIEEGVLADTGLLLLLALCFNPVPSNSPLSNPFRKALHTLRDAEELFTDTAAESGEAGGGGDEAVSSVASVSFSAVFDTLAAQLTKREGSLLLLYVLLHGCPHFQEYCLVRSDLDTLLLPLMELLYNASERTPNQLYMLLIILLILSQDATFSQNIHRVNIHSVPFYKERSVTNTSIGSLLVVLLLRTAHYNLAKLRDVYLHTNTLAALANLAPHMTGLSTHAAQRLLSLFALLAKRYAKLQQEEFASDPDPSNPQSNAASDRRKLEIQLYGDFLRIVLEIVNSILVNALPSNPELVYALLHRQEVLAPFREHPQFAELMENITLVTEHFGRRVEEALGDRHDGEVSAESVLTIVKLSSRGWRKDRLKTFPELRFTYEEEATAEEFFVPYVWSTIVSCLDQIPWNLRAITLFTPTIVGAGDVGEGGLSPPLTARGQTSSSNALGPGLQDKGKEELEQEPIADNV